MVDYIIFGMFRLYLHEPDHVTQSRAHVGDNDWAMPIGLGANRHFVKEDVAQKMVSVQNHTWRSGFIDKNHPFFSGSIQLPQERIARRALERWQHWPSAHNWQRDDAAGVNRLSLIQHGDIVEVEKIQCADRFQSSDISAPGLHVLRHQDAEVPLAKPRNTFRPKPPIEQQSRGFCNREEYQLIELEKDYKPGGDA